MSICQPSRALRPSVPDDVPAEELPRSASRLPGITAKPQRHTEAEVSQKTGSTPAPWNMDWHTLDRGFCIRPGLRLTKTDAIWHVLSARRCEAALHDRESSMTWRCASVTRGNKLYDAYLEGRMSRRAVRLFFVRTLTRSAGTGDLPWNRQTASRV